MDRGWAGASAALGTLPRQCCNGGAAMPPAAPCPLPTSVPGARRGQPAAVGLLWMGGTKPESPGAAHKHHFNDAGRLLVPNGLVFPCTAQLHPTRYLMGRGLCPCRWGMWHSGSIGAILPSASPLSSRCCSKGWGHGVHFYFSQPLGKRGF